MTTARAPAWFRGADLNRARACSRAMRYARRMIQVLEANAKFARAVNREPLADSLECSAALLNAGRRNLKNAARRYFRYLRRRNAISAHWFSLRAKRLRECCEILSAACDVQFFEAGR